MSRVAVVALILTTGVALCGSGRPREPGRGFHLPDGDPARGQAAFVELRCNSCHRVSGVPLADPVADPPVPVVLGGRFLQVRTDDELVTAIVDPSRSVVLPALPDVRSGDLSRMGDFGDTMTVRQLMDIVAFIQAHTTVEESLAIR